MGWFRRRDEPAPPAPVRAAGPLTPDLVAQVAGEHLTPAGAELLVGSLRRSLRLVHRGEQPCVGRLGGAAVLDEGQEWPHWDGRALTVVAVLDLQALPEVPGVPLPRSGWLTFFYDVDEQDAWGFDPAQRDAWRVVASSATAQPVEGEIALPVVELGAVEEWTLPDASEPVLDPLRRSEGDALWEVVDALPEAGTAHRAGGWPDLVQGSLWLGAQLASHGLYVGGPEGYADPRADALRAGAADWRLLLQVDSDDAAGTMWGDLGRLYFLMTADDLAAGRFERAWFELQCG